MYVTQDTIMRDEILKGIFGGLFCIIIFVSIGSFIGKATSHGPKPTTAKAKATKNVDAKKDAKTNAKADTKATPKADKKAEPKK